jgi:hypothetical protein
MDKQPGQRQCDGQQQPGPQPGRQKNPHAERPFFFFSPSGGRPLAGRRPAPPTPASSREAAPPPSGLENFPEPAELVTETAGVKAELRQQIGVLAIIGVHLVRELLSGLLSLVVVALALQQLHNLVFADVHKLPFPQTGESETLRERPYFRECLPGLQPAMRIDVAVDTWLLDLLPVPGGSPYYPLDTD